MWHHIYIYHQYTTNTIVFLPSLHAWQPSLSFETCHNFDVSDYQIFRPLHKLHWTLLIWRTLCLRSMPLFFDETNSSRHCVRRSLKVALIQTAAVDSTR